MRDDVLHAEIEPGVLRIHTWAVLALAVAAVLLLAACATPVAGGDQGPVPPAPPAAPKLDTPGSAVRSYLDWTSLAYRMANSDLASATCTPEWGVHVDSYIQLNRENGAKAIEQRLTRFEQRSESVEGTKAVVAATEDWDYRYFALSDQHWTTPPYKASYDTTYTLVMRLGQWLVDDVVATPLTEVK
jgi:hypothetical protein